MRFNFLSRQHISHESKKSIKFVVKDRWLNKMVNISRDNYVKLLVNIEKVQYNGLETISIIFKLNSPYHCYSDLAFICQENFLSA